MSDSTLTIVEGWRDRLTAAGLDTLEALLTLQRGRLISDHARGWLREVELPDGQVVYVKCARGTKLKQIARDLFCLRRPEPLTERERLGIERVRRLGIAAPEALAWGQRRLGPLPWRGALVMAPLAGVAMDEFLRRQPGPAVRRAVLRSVGKTVRKLHDAGLSWPDLRVKHVYVDDAGRIGLLDLERLAPRWPGTGWRANRVRRRFRKALRGVGADEGDLAALMDGLGQ